MKSFKHFVKEQSLDFVEPDLKLDTGKTKQKTITIHVSFGHHLKNSNDLNENFINEQTENDVTKPHSDEDIKKFHAENRAKDEKIPDSIDKDHPGFLKHYTQGDSTFQNNALWDHHNKRTDFKDRWGSHEENEPKHQRNLTLANSASNVLGKHKTSRDFTVFSGIGQEHAEKFKNRSHPLEVHHPAMMSTSTDFEQASKFTGGAPKSGEERHVLKLHLPKGTQAASVRHFSNYKKENEILLNRGYNLQIHHEPTIINHPKHGKIHVWHAKIVGHNPEKLNTKPLKDVL